MMHYARQVSLLLCLFVAGGLLLVPAASAVSVSPSGSEDRANSDSDSQVEAITIGAVVVAVAILLWVGWRAHSDPDYMGREPAKPALPPLVQNDALDARLFVDLGPAVPDARRLEQETTEPELAAATVGLRVRF